MIGVYTHARIISFVAQGEWKQELKLLKKRKDGDAHLDGKWV